MEQNTKSVLLTIANSRNSFTAYLLLFFFGWLGIHQLYLSKPLRWLMQMAFTALAIYGFFDTGDSHLTTAVVFYVLLILSLGYDWLTLWWQVRRANTKIINKQAKRDSKIAV
jgi:hypothetical protein